MRPAPSRALALAALLVMAAAAEAQTVGGEICYGAVQAAAQVTTNSTLFSCPLAGSKTLPQLAAGGWRIVRLTLLADSGGTVRPQLVIQGRDRVFRHGFE